MRIRHAIQISLMGLILLAGCTTPPKGLGLLPIENQSLTLSSGKGTLVVTLRQEGMTTQAALADIDHMQVDVLVGETEKYQVLTKSQITSSTPTLTFSSLPEGSASLLLTAFDSASNAIGAVEGAATVIANQTTQVPMTLRLADSGLYTAIYMLGTTQGYLDSSDYSMAQFDNVNGIALTDGDINSLGAYFADTNNNAIRKYDPNTWEVCTLAGGTAGFADGTGTAAKFNLPQGIVMDSAQNIYVADTGNNAIRKITPAGVVTTLASSISSPQGIAMAPSGDLYVSTGTTHQILRVSTSGDVTVIAGSGSGCLDGTGVNAKFASPSGLAVDSNENVYVADTGNNRIRKMTPGGVVTTLAGGVAGYQDGSKSNAKFLSPYGVAIEASGSLLVTDMGNHKIRKVSQTGMVTTVAGSTQGSAIGCGSYARFNAPTGIAINASGSIMVSDRDNYRLLMLESGKN